MGMVDGNLQAARAHFFKALGDPARLDILKMLGREKRRSVTEIYRSLGHAQSLVSHHLLCLKNCGLVVSEKQGKQVFYRLRNRQIEKLITLADRCIKDVLETVLYCEAVSDEKELRKKLRSA